jgi:hypothetical protein
MLDELMSLVIASLQMTLYACWLPIVLVALIVTLISRLTPRKRVKRHKFDFVIRYAISLFVCAIVVLAVNCAWIVVVSEPF